MQSHSPEYEPTLAAYEEQLIAAEDLLMGMALRLTDNRTLAEDAVQDVYVKALERREQFEGRSQLGTWLVAVLRNHIIDLARAAVIRNKHETLVVDGVAGLEVESPYAHPVRSFIDNESTRSVLEELEEVPERQRSAVLLRIMGLNHQEIADVLGIKFGTAKSNAKRGLDKIREKRGL